VKIAIHRYESSVVENTDDTLSRRRQSFLARLMSRIILKLLSAFIHFGKIERFKPDFYLEEGDDLLDYGFDARILLLPGHSKGSIGILTTGSDPSTGPGQVLFCGDLLWNMRKPGPHGMIDDAAEMKASLERLKNLDIKTIYPGHGKPFPLAALAIRR
jgi:hydroxyacylglutathione hydrolase